MVHNPCVHLREYFSREYLDIELQSWKKCAFKILIDIVKSSSEHVVPVYTLAILFERTSLVPHQYLLSYFTRANITDKKMASQCTYDPDY